MYDLNVWGAISSSVYLLELYWVVCFLRILINANGFLLNFLLCMLFCVLAVLILNSELCKGRLVM